MRAPWCRRRALLVALVGLPLLAVGTCAQIADRAVINGYFNALNAALLEQARTCLGLDS